MQVFKCDGIDCKSEEKDAELLGWITIGSSDSKSLKVINNIPNSNLAVMGNHTDLHFCSKECLVKRIFNNENFIL